VQGPEFNPQHYKVLKKKSTLAVLSISICDNLGIEQKINNISYKPQIKQDWKVHLREAILARHPGAQL
jgi:hypothetical protein